MEVVPAPASPEGGLAGPKEVVGGANSRLVEQSPGGEPTQGDTGVHLVPFESAVIRGGGTARGVGRLVEDRIAESFPINPRLEMSEADSKVECQSLGQLPVVLDEALIRVIRNVVDSVERGFVLFVCD